MMIRPGMPTTVAPGGTSLVTTALEPTLAPLADGERAEHLGTGTDHYVVAEGGVALALVPGGAAQG